MAGKKLNLLNMSQNELEDWMTRSGFEKYRGRQIFQWIYKKDITDFDQMSDLPRDLRKVLKQNFYFHIPEIISEQNSRDGTSKFCFELEDHHRIEAVLIPDRMGNSLCLSSQVGCRFGCRFCYTGTISFKRDLSSGEILGQFFAVRRRLSPRSEIHRLVFMGMGEPLDNFEELKKAIGIFCSHQGLNLSPKRITISTAGITKLIPEAFSLGVNLAISINSADQSKRELLMPITKKYPPSELVKTIKTLDRSTRQKLTAEYVMLKNFNDSLEDAHRLAQLFSGVKIMVNLIRFNPFPGCEFEPSDDERIIAFQDCLKQAGFMVFIRKSKGGDILAACGQLSGGKK